MRCKAYDSARKAGSVVDVRNAVFIGGVHHGGRANLYDTGCNFALFGASYANDAVGRALLAKIVWSEAEVKRGDAKAVFLLADGKALFQKGSPDFVFQITKVDMVAPVPPDEEKPLIDMLKVAHRLLPDAVAIDQPIPDGVFSL